MSDPPRPAPDKQQSPKSMNGSGAAQTAYLALYNLVSAILWGVIFVRVALVTPGWGSAYVYESTGAFVKWTQTLAALEIGHSVFGTTLPCPPKKTVGDNVEANPRGDAGLVRAPLFTTLLQVGSRLLMVWGIWHFFPGVPAREWATATMLLAWSATETVRYGFFFGQLGGLEDVGGTPPWLTWLRYNTFFVLYPMGISSECWLIYKSIGPAVERDERLGYVLGAILAGYIPGT
ncbi:MAG: protein tyrosine phosphatase-like domain-containing protein [Terriglobus roseus]|nr:protein tyrosine phosphatase-like domain-containing protein [Terriglobus roseus]